MRHIFTDRADLDLFTFNNDADLSDIAPESLSISTDVTRAVDSSNGTAGSTNGGSLLAADLVGTNSSFSNANVTFEIYNTGSGTDDSAAAPAAVSGNLTDGRGGADATNSGNVINFASNIGICSTLGNETFAWSDETNFITGEGEFNTLDYPCVPSRLNVNIATGIVLDRYGGRGYFGNLQQVIGSSDHHLLTAGPDGDTVNGEPGASTITGQVDGDAATFSLQFRGFDYVAFFNGAYEDSNSLPSLVQTGANSIEATLDYGIDVTTSQVVADPNYTDSLAALGNTIAQAESLGLSVMVRPLIDFLDPAEIAPYSVGEWRQDYQPTNVAVFFASYKQMIVAEAEVAQQNGAQMLSIGAELDQLAGPQYLSYWTDIINSVRAVFGGDLTYSASWNTANNVSFWSQLNYEGIDCYVPLSNVQNPTFQDLVNGWIDPATTSTNPGAYAVIGNQSPIQYFENLSANSGKPLLFTELGYANDSGAAADPSASGNSPDPGLQGELYQAFFQAWTQSGSQSLVGTYFWYWDPNGSPSNVGPGIDSFSPQNSPAQIEATAGFNSLPAQLPDLTATNFSLSGTSVSCNINNIGAAMAGTSSTGIYLSTNGTIDAADSLIATVSTSSLTAGASDIESVSLSFPSNLTPGIYYLGAIANYNNQVVGSNEGNSASNSVPIILDTITTVGSIGTLTGTSSDDVMVGLNVNGDIFNGEAGDNTMIGGGGNNTFDLWSDGPGTDYSNYINGGSGFNTLDYSQSPGAVNVNMATGTTSNYYGGTDYFSNIEQVVGSDYNDWLIGGSTGVEFNAGTGNETMIGGTGNVTFDIRTHNPGSNFSDYIAGGSGYNILNYSGAPGPVNVNMATETTSNYYGGTDYFSNIQEVLGSAYNDALTASSTSALFNGEGGNNTMVGGAGNDLFELWSDGPGTDNSNYINGGGGINTLDYSQSPGPVNVNLMTGQSSNYYGGTDYFSNIQDVVGSPFNDVLVANGAGTVLSGEGGNDTFEFVEGHTNGATVTDFASGTDSILFNGFGTSGATFVKDTSTTWTVNSSNGLDHETITFSNAPTIQSNDYHFV